MGCRYLVLANQIEAVLIAALRAFSVTRKTCTPTQKLRRSEKTACPSYMDNVLILPLKAFRCQQLTLRASGQHECVPALPSGIKGCAAQYLAETSGAPLSIAFIACSA